MPSFFFNDTATTEIYPLSLPTLFRSPWDTNPRLSPPPAHRSRPRERPPSRLGARSEEHTSELQSQSNLVCRPFFLMIRRPPRSTLFPYRRSSDLLGIQILDCHRLPLTVVDLVKGLRLGSVLDRKSTRLNSSHSQISYAVLFF